VDVARRQRLVQRRKMVGCSQERLAELVDVDRSTIGRWEAGETEPLPWLRPRLARALRVDAEQLQDLLLDAAAGPGDRLDHAVQHPATTDLSAVASLRQRLLGLEQRYEQVPSTALLAEAGQCLGTVTFLRAHAGSTRVRRDLLVTEAEAATLLGQLTWDASQRRDHVTARMYYARAVEAAQQVGHPAAESLAVLRMCFVALYGEKEPREGLALARRAGDLAATSSPVLRGLAALHAGEAHSMMGQAGETDVALGQAQAYLERATADDVAADMFGPAHLDRLAGSCHLALGRHELAETTLARAAHHSNGLSKALAIILGNLALARLGQRKVDGATEAVHQAIDVLEVTWGGGGLSVVFAAARQLRPWADAAAVADVQDRLLSLIATAPGPRP
jgi:DNA-binding XRE family transcriptional regulator